MKRIISIILVAVIIFVPISTSNSSDMDAKGSPLILTIDLDDMITAGTAARIERGVQEAEERDATALVLLLDTPGGLVDSTLKIISDLSASNVPIITYVTPQGAIAASAGSFILLGGHITAMSPGTTTGAAMPVTITPGEEETQTADDKTILFLAGHIRSIAETNGRPGDIAERFVTENLTISSLEALELGVADYIEPNLVSLLGTIHGQEIQFQGKTIMMDTEDAVIESIEPDLTEKITHLISNPQITFILLMVGVYGIIFGVNNPGTFVPEVLGAISLILALFGLGMFEVNLFAVIMIFLGMGLLVAEALTPTYGVLGTGGVVSVVLGIIYLPVEPLVTSRWLIQFRLMAIGIGAVGSIFLVILLAGLVRLRKTPVYMGENEFLNELGITMENLDPQGLVRVKGELWKAQTRSESFVPAGTHIRVLERHQMVLIVEPVDKE
ncbi:NfeD family protein [Gudongella sp. DL1XJH-153]|uniref:NfeD family protein n=1 Tax=Gudongella sp. DL1XJH-153 TaxID=3409804 RepID=UPI003BB61E41